MKTKVLLVDDEPTFTALVKLNLEKTDQYEVRTVNWAEDAFRAVHEFRPHIILLDIIMPRMPGGNVAAQIESDPAIKNTPIVFLTAAVRRLQVEENQGVICGRPCLAKPTSVDELVATIEKHRRRREDEQGSG